MKKHCLVISFYLLAVNCFSQDTFSICAVDTITGEVGGAGASCIDNSAIAGGVVIINDIHPGKGVIHTQAQWLAANQNTAKTQMNLGQSPQQIIAWMQTHDVQSNPSIRQYGVVDLDSSGKARSAAFTGTNCMDYKNHIVGPNYSIQGNILLGQQILDSMEARFLNATGDLACKLMAALQGAKVPGADTRCLTSGNSSLSSFLRVAKPGETMPNIYLNLIVKSGPVGFEPIDSLQTLFNQAHNCLTAIHEYDIPVLMISISPNPAKDEVTFKGDGSLREFSIEIFNALGQNVLSEMATGSREHTVNISSFQKGLYLYRITSKEGKTAAGKFAKN